MKRTVILVAGWLVLAGGAALADESHPFLHNTNPANPLFECGEKTMGQVACQAGNRCKCIYNAFGDAMRGLPPGYRWDCGLGQGSCLVDVPAETSGHWGNPPPSQPQPQPVIRYPAPGSGTGSGSGAGP